MTCFKCGAQVSVGQKFCRSCGAGLQVITQPLPEPASRSETSVALQSETQRASRLVLWGFIIMFVGAAIGVIGKMLIHVDAVTVAGVLFSLVGIFLTVYPYVAPSPRTKHDLDHSQPELLPQPQPTKSLPHETPTEYVPSITERTTDLLKNPVSRKERRSE